MATEIIIKISISEAFEGSFCKGQKERGKFLIIFSARSEQCRAFGLFANNASTVHTDHHHPVAVHSPEIIPSWILERAQATSGFNDIILYNPDAWDSCDAAWTGWSLDPGCNAIGGGGEWRRSTWIGDWIDDIGEQSDENSYTLCA